jgi:hypothetical protein
MQLAPRSLGQGSAVPGEVRLAAAAWNLKYHILLSDCLFVFFFSPIFCRKASNRILIKRSCQKHKVAIVTILRSCLTYFPTSCGRSVSIVRSRTQATELVS